MFFIPLILHWGICGQVNTIPSLLKRKYRAKKYCPENIVYRTLFITK